MFESSARPLPGAGVSGAVRRIRRMVTATMAVLALAACAQPKTMYSWQSYQTNVYTYLKEDNNDYAVQAASLEKNVEIARSANQPLPPGFHAHLGMLYLKLGNGTKAVEQMQAEKAAFPESATFMDFLLRNATASAADGAAPGLKDTNATSGTRGLEGVGGAAGSAGAGNPAATEGAKAPAAPDGNPGVAPAAAKGA